MDKAVTANSTQKTTLVWTLLRALGDCYAEKGKSLLQHIATELEACISETLLCPIASFVETKSLTREPN